MVGVEIEVGATVLRKDVTAAGFGTSNIDDTTLTRPVCELKVAATLGLLVKLYAPENRK